MRFFTPYNSFEFENPSQYPKSEPYELQQIRERSAGGTIHVETFARPIRSRVMNFEQMSDEDYTGLLDWYLNKVNGMADTFTFEDEIGKAYTVRFTDRSIGFKNTNYDRWAGRINLEIVS